MMEYGDFRYQYEQMHPASVPQREDYVQGQVYPNWLRHITATMFICAALLSAVHTIPTVRESIPPTDLIAPWILDLVSIASFAAIELAIFVTGYAVVRKGSWWVYGVMLAAVLVAMTANLRSVSIALSGGNPLDIATALILGLIVPLIALLSGKLFVDIQHGQLTQNRLSAQLFKTALIEHDTNVRDAYQEYVRKHEKAERRTQPPELARTRPADKPKPAADKSVDKDLWLYMDTYLDPSGDTFKDGTKVSVRTLTDAFITDSGLSIGRSKVHELLTKWKQAHASNHVNGNGAHE